MMMMMILMNQLDQYTTDCTGVGRVGRERKEGLTYIYWCISWTQTLITEREKIKNKMLGYSTESVMHLHPGVDPSLGPCLDPTKQTVK